ncbi:MAG: class I SAM-dependent methyltransferase [Eubacterium sp.]
MIDTGKITNQFNSDAKAYDSKRRKFIPCFDDYYISSTKFIAEVISPPKRILDLGAGTGLLTRFWYNEFPKANYVLDDISFEMLNVAKKRFSDAQNVYYATNDYSKALPDGDFDAVISALSIHHLDNRSKQSLFNIVFDRLPKDGVFVNYDMFNADTEEMTEQYNRYWENTVLNCGLPPADIEHWKKGRSIDRECSVNEEIAMLKNAGFKNVNCIYSSIKFGVILAIK